MPFPLTPPATPQKAVNKSSPSDASPLANLSAFRGKRSDLATASKVDTTEINEPDTQDGIITVPLNEVPSKPSPYMKGYSLSAELGRGVWSHVYEASEVSKPDVSAVLASSPPQTPATGHCNRKRKVLAVKLPSRKDARKILEREARVLTYVHSQAMSYAYLVPFYGFDIAQNAIVLEAVPLNLDSHVKSAATSDAVNRNLLDPVIGVEIWADLASKLVSGLAFLQGIGCVHGDIKPSNVLLRRDIGGKLIPLYCDFSSSRVMFPDTQLEDVDEVTAVTTDYLSPELLESFYHRNGKRAVTTFASDIFALAVTLLFAAIGESPYAGAQMDLQKLAMAKEGRPMDFARSGGQACRVRKGKGIDQALMYGLQIDAAKRSEVLEWKLHIQRVQKVWKGEVPTNLFDSAV